MAKKRLFSKIFLYTSTLLLVHCLRAQPLAPLNSVEFLNNSESTLVVNNQKAEPGETISIPFDKKVGVAPLFSIKEGIKRYRIYYRNKKEDNLPSVISLDFATICFIAENSKRRDGFDEICLHNDTLYDIAVSYSYGPRNAQYIKQYHKQKNIVLEPGRIFHKTVYCADEKTDIKHLRSLGLLILSIAMAENNKLYTHSFKRCIYNDPSLIGTKDWNSVTLSADTIKWFNNGFSVSYN